MAMEIGRQMEVILGKGRITRMEMENLQAMLQLRSKSLYGLVSDIKQNWTKVNFIDDGELWVDDDAVWL